MMTGVQGNRDNGEPLSQSGTCPQFEFTHHSNLMICEKLKQNQKLFKKEFPTVLILISG